MCTPFRIGLLVAGLLLITSNVEAQQGNAAAQVNPVIGAREVSGTSPSPAAASAPIPSSYWLVLNLNSLHADRNTPYNERNYGLGFEKVINNLFSVELGFYNNSFYHNTRYGSITWKPLGDAEGVRAGLSLTCLSGYEDGKLLCIPLPVISYETRHLAVEVIVTPEVLGLRTKWRF